MLGAPPLGAQVKCPYRAKIKPPLEVVVADLSTRIDQLSQKTTSCRKALDIGKSVCYSGHVKNIAIFGGKIGECNVNFEKI